MRTLYLIRHAKSSWNNSSLADFDRPLNSRGKRDALFMAQKFLVRQEQVAAFVSSPAKRAITTARFVAKAFQMEDQVTTNPEVYHAAAATLLRIVNGFDDAHEQVALYGHNPGFTDLLDTLTGAGVYNMPTCAIARVDIDVASWQAVSAGNGSLIWFDYPKRYPELSYPAE